MTPARGVSNAVGRGVLALAGVASQAACGAPAPPTSAAQAQSVPLYAGFHVEGGVADFPPDGENGLSLVLSNVPICEAYRPTEPFFLVSLSLYETDAQGRRLPGRPGFGTYGAVAPAAADGHPGSWAVAQLDAFGPVGDANSWQSAPLARAVAVQSGVFTIDTLSTPTDDGAGLQGKVTFRDLAFDTPAWTGPAAGQATAVSPCRLSLLPRDDAPSP